VLRPETLDENLARKLLVLSSRVDDDPFVDFAYGVITGDSPKGAVALAGAGVRAEAGRRRPNFAMIGVAGSELPNSMSMSQNLPLRKGFLKHTSHMIAAGEAANATSAEIDPKQDGTFIREVMPQLADQAIVLFAGHGYPTHVVGGPTYRHLAGQRLDGAVVMNIACYTGVTSRWFDNDWKSMKIRERTVPANESFCLNMLNTGAAAYVAYVCPRPAGPTMIGDAITLATAGESVGELWRKNANSVVLAQLQQGRDELNIAEVADGEPIARKRKTQDILTSMSTGGVLFGDPAFVPFAAQAGAHPAQVKVVRKANSLLAEVEVVGPLFHLFCSDQIVMWDDKTPSMRLEAVVPLGDRHVKGVRLVRSSFGEVPHRLTAATEEHAGQRFAHVKASFAQPEMQQMMQLAQTGAMGTFEIITTDKRQESAIVRHAEAQ
jgi:hypothetical protein